MKMYKKIIDIFKNFINGGEKYKNSNTLNGIFADYIEWHHKKNKYPIFKRGKVLDLLDEFFTEKNIIIYDVQILHGANHRKPRKELIIALVSAIAGMLLATIIALILF